jgi:hypothetical protein
MGLQHPEEADVDAARCRGYLLGKEGAERLAALEAKETYAAGYKAGLLAGLRRAQRACAWNEQLTHIMGALIAHVERTGELPEEEA